jgi:hypothetical protein
VSALVYTPAAGTALFAVSLVWPVVRARYVYRGRHRAGLALGSSNQRPRVDVETAEWAVVA